MDRERFQSIVLGYYRRHPRHFPWRETSDPYAILVSEIMLQQTQTARVVPKYQAFLETFPTVHHLADADLAQVLRLWQGLGYNRRARYLKLCAETVAHTYSGQFPATREELRELPGVGEYTSGAVCAFAFGLPVAFLETNIRRVYLHFYFPDREGVKDKEIMPTIEETLFVPDPRTWYYALMDYGVMLGSVFPNANRRSAHYAVQSKFENSTRQIRGQVLKLLSNRPCAHGEILSSLSFEPERIEAALRGLEKDELVVREGDTVYLPGD